VVLPFLISREIMQSNQKTLKQRVSFSGIGVHSGLPSAVTLLPAPEDHGVIFINKANHKEKIIVGQVVPEAAMHATVMRSGGWMLSTVEHLVAALVVLGVDNVLIEVEGSEIPILDGSALPFVQGVIDAGIVEQDAIRHYLTPKLALIFDDGKGRSIVIKPAREGLVIDYSAEFSNDLAGKSIMKEAITTDFFMKELAPARTFGHIDQLPFLRQHGLAKGTSLGNSVVIGQELMNDMRMTDECLKHKVLDLIGDLSLLGKPLIGSIKAQKTGHNFNRQVVAHYIEHPDQWELV